jgi:hypothetical protein
MLRETTWDWIRKMFLTIHQKDVPIDDLLDVVEIAVLVA